MFGKNPILKQDLQNQGNSLHLVKGSPFLTIQGEGPYSGHPAVFIRLHGCNLACTFCDTNFSDPEDPILSLGVLSDAVDIIRSSAKHAVITGGEPLRQNILPLCQLLKQHNLKVQIETAGTLWIEGIEQHAEIVCSPKTAKIHPKVSEHAVAFKYVIDTNQQFDGFIPITATQAGARPSRLAGPGPRKRPVYLSPMDCYDEEKNAANRKLVGELAIRYGCIAGLQVHKFMNLD